MTYIGHTKEREQIFVNSYNVIAVIDDGGGKAPTKVVLVGGTEIIIADKSWNEINNELNRG